MKRVIIVILGTVLVGYSGIGFCQQKNATMAFAKTVHDFGAIEESAGPVTCDFEFTNTGSIPVIINRVAASCGCTSPSWTNEPVVPGGKGFIKATYDPRNRPGKFSKTVTVFSNAEQSAVVLKIMGDVIPRLRTIEDDYPYQIGDIRLKSNHIAFVKVFSGQQNTTLMEVINISEKPVTMTFESVPEHLRIQAAPKVLRPNEKGIIEASYDAGKKNDWGFVVDRINVLLNGEAVKNNMLTISATIEEDFTSLSPAEMEKSARIQFEEKTFNFGKISQNSSVTHEFVFTNTGKSDLVLRKISSSCGCTVVSPKENVISAGKSSSITATFNAGGRRGVQNKTITIITNDPKNPTVVLRVSGEVEVSSSGN